MKELFILGSTGSIGTSTLDVCRQHPSSFRVKALVAGKSWQKLLEQANEFNPEWVILTDPSAADAFSREYNGRAKVLSGFDDILTLLKNESFGMLVNALVGAKGLVPTVEAIRNGISVALANKESLVMAGQLINQLLSEHTNVVLHPIDSEHSAIWQVIQGESKKNLEKIILTASGGPFRGYSSEQLKKVTPEQALKHPTWKMGPKITIDSATLMNKGLEIIEAYWLYHLPPEKIEVVVHPESIIHSMVQFTDGSIKAQLSIPDMRIPIAYALTYPERVQLNVETISFKHAFALHFEPPDLKTFKSLSLAYEALKNSPVHPAVLNAANEIAVEAFLKGEISFPEIMDLVQILLEKQTPVTSYSLEQILEIDRLTREKTINLIKRRK